MILTQLQNLHDGDNVTLKSGIYYLPSPLTISGKNIKITGENNTIIRAAESLSESQWIYTGDGIYYTEINGKADALYINDRKYTMARYPKFKSNDEVFGGYSADCTEPSKTSDWKNPKGGYIHAMHRELWGGYSYKITGKNDDGTLKLEGGWQNNRQMGMHEKYRYAENIYEEMTEKGEWYFDESNGRIYVIPFDGDDLSTAEAAVSHSFFKLSGCENVTIENIVFERSSRTFMETSEPLLRSDWTIYRSGAVVVQNSVNCSITGCTFRDIGSNAVFVDGNNENISVSKSLITEIGASGVCFVGCSDSVRNPLFEYGETLSVNEIDKTRGPKSDNYPKNCNVTNCLI